jgi:hypothetical protein
MMSFAFSAGGRVPLARRSPVWEDQVPRREEFQHRHPEVTITPPGRATGVLWRARIRGSDDMIAKFELRDLLDALEELLGDNPP